MLDQPCAAVGLDRAAVRARVLALVAGRPLARGAALVATMGGALVMLFAVPLARQELALQLPPVSVCVQVAVVVLAAIGGLTVWRRVGWRPEGRGGDRSGGTSARHELGGDAAGPVRGDGEADADAA